MIRLDIDAGDATVGWFQGRSRAVARGARQRIALSRGAPPLASGSSLRCSSNQLMNSGLRRGCVSSFIIEHKIPRSTRGACRRYPSTASRSPSIQSMWSWLASSLKALLDMGYLSKGEDGEYLDAMTPMLLAPFGF